MKISVHGGKGEGPTPLAAFDAALLDAGVCNYNLLCLSSVIPPQSVVDRTRYEAKPDEYGHRLYVVMAHRQEQVPGREAWAGLGWTQEPTDGRGLFVELEGETRTEVERKITDTLRSMIASRPYTFGPIDHEVVGIQCQKQPVCALVVAVYESQGWSRANDDYN